MSQLASFFGKKNAKNKKFCKWQMLQIQTKLSYYIAAK